MIVKSFLVLVLSQPIAESFASPTVTKDLVCFWDFHEPTGEDRVSIGPNSYHLEEMGGPIERVSGGPYGLYAARIKSGQWFRIPRDKFSALDFFGTQARLTVVAWLRRESKSAWQAVAGVWNETEGQRQYCLFLNAASRTDAKTMTRKACRDLVHGHVSDVGGNTSGEKACITYSSSAQPVLVGEWQMVAMTYDGSESKVFVGGNFIKVENQNPFPLSKSLFHGNAEFTVGAVDRHGEIGNFLNGTLSGLAIYSRALSEDELKLLTTLK